MPSRTTEELSDRLVESLLATFDVYSIYLGDRVGYYRALDGGAMNSTQLAKATNTSERYAREWLEQQAVSGLIEVDAPSADDRERTYRLDDAARRVLADEDSDAFMAVMARQVAAAGFQLPGVAEAFRTGRGVPWRMYGDDMLESQADANKALFLTTLGEEWLPAIPAVHEALGTAGARVADIGCGFGWSSIGIARAYPEATVDGFDKDPVSIAAAGRNALEHDVADRVTFHLADGADADGAYDLVIALECLHDMSDPVAVLGTMRSLAGDAGTVLIVDERTEDAFTTDAGAMERLLYGFSLTTCLPDGMSTQPSAGTGTVMRPSTLQRYAESAGFSGMEILDIDHEQFRIYLLA